VQKYGFPSEGSRESLVLIAKPSELLLIRTPIFSDFHEDFQKNLLSKKAFQ
jgi:hypothetical protein